MSAPAAVAVAKLNYPETEVTKFQTEEDFHISAKQVQRSHNAPHRTISSSLVKTKQFVYDIFRKERNCVEAAIKGAFQAAKAATALMVEILACYSLYVFLNATIGWFMSRVSLEGDLEVRILTSSPTYIREQTREFCHCFFFHFLQTVFAYMFMPLVYMIGVDWSEAFKVGRVMGIKLIPNEMLAYMELGTLRTEGELSVRTQCQNSKLTIINAMLSPHASVCQSVLSQGWGVAI